MAPTDKIKLPGGVINMILGTPPSLDVLGVWENFFRYLKSDTHEFENELQELHNHVEDLGRQEQLDLYLKFYSRTKGSLDNKDKFWEQVSEFCRETLSPNPSNRPPAPTVPISVASDFHAKLLGDSLDAIKEVMLSNEVTFKEADQSGRGIYAKILPIVQSTGTG